MARPLPSGAQLPVLSSWPFLAASAVLIQPRLQSRLVHVTHPALQEGSSSTCTTRAVPRLAFEKKSLVVGRGHGRGT